MDVREQKIKDLENGKAVLQCRWSHKVSYLNKISNNKYLLTTFICNSKKFDARRDLRGIKYLDKVDAHCYLM